MNTIKHVVTEIVGEPKYREWTETEMDGGGNPYQVKYICWTLEVKANSHGSIQTTTLTFDTKEEVEKVSEGYEFLA